MTGKERTLATMHHETPDRVPVTFYTHVNPGDDNGFTNYTNWIKETGMDLLCMEPDPWYGLRWPTPLRTIDDFLEVRPFKKTDPYIAKQVERAARLSEALPDTACYYMLFTPFAIIKDSVDLGQTGNMIIWNGGHDKCKQVMDVLMENNLLLMEELKKNTDLTGLFVSLQSGEKWRFSPAEYREHLRPYDLQLLNAVNETYADNIVHMCSWGNEPNNIENWQEYPYKVVNWGIFQEDDLDSMKKGRDFFREGTVVMGGFDRLPEGVLYRGTEEEIKAYTKALIADTGKEDFIISADCSIMEDTPNEHIRWVIEAAEEY